MKKRKKGFTIVELVIVIAVIAILAAVLIPTFSNIIKSARTSSDLQLIRNLNTLLATDKATGAEHKTMQEALDCVAEGGYLVDRINASNNDNEILWDSKNDLFCYLKKDGNIEYIPEDKANLKFPINEGATYDNSKVQKVDYFVIVNSQAELNQRIGEGLYSIYAADKEYNAEVVVKTGFDAGLNDEFIQISYVNTDAQKAHEVVFVLIAQAQF